MKQFITSFYVSPIDVSDDRKYNAEYNFEINRLKDVFSFRDFLLNNIKETPAPSSLIEIDNLLIKKYIEKIDILYSKFDKMTKQEIEKVLYCVLIDMKYNKERVFLVGFSYGF